MVTVNAQTDSNAIVIKKVTFHTINSISYSAFTYQVTQKFYSSVPYSSFHLVNDYSTWGGMDKITHMYVSASFNKANYLILNHLYSSKKAVLYASINTLAYSLTKELGDSHVAVAGFSLYDMIANCLGIGIFSSQQLIWNKEKIKLKYSFFFSSYAKYNPDELGASIFSQVINDYNGITYWITPNIASIIDIHSKYLRIINLSFGYGVDGMLASKTNSYIEYINAISPIERTSEFYFSLDIDWDEIKVKNKLLRTFLTSINFIKVPFPAISVNTNKQFSFYPLGF